MTTTILAETIDPARPGTLGLPPPGPIPLELRAFIVTGEKEDPSNGARISTFEEEISGSDLEEFIAAVGDYRSHRGCRLPSDWRGRLARDGQLELDAGVLIMGINQ